MVIGAGAAGGGRALAVGDIPDVYFVVEGFGVLHVESEVDFGLDAEEPFGVAGVFAEFGGHGGGGLEEFGVELAPSEDNGVFVVKDVEVGFAGVGVDGGLDGVADVVDAAGGAGADGIGEGVGVGGGVAVGHPDEAAFFGEDEVGVFVPGEETGEGFQAGADAAVDHHAAAGLEGAGEDDVGIGVGDGGDEAHGEGADGKAAGAVVVVVDVVGAGRVVEFGLGGADEDGFMGDFAEVDFGTGELHAGHGDFGRGVLDEEIGEAVDGDFVGVCGNDAVAVGVDDVAVGPAVAGLAELLDVEFAGGEHDLLEFAVDAVAVDVGVDVAVGAEGLDLADGVVEGLPVPEADVVEEVAVFIGVEGGIEIGPEEFGLGGALELVGLAGGVHVVLDEGALEGELVGFDVDRVDEAGDDALEGQDEEGAEGKLTASGGDEGGGGEGGADEEPVEGDADVGGDVVDAGHEGVVLVGEVVAVEEEVGGEGDEGEGGEGAGAGGDAAEVLPIEFELAGGDGAEQGAGGPGLADGEVDEGGGGEGGNGERGEGFKEGEGEEVEGDGLAKEGIGGTGGGGGLAAGEVASGVPAGEGDSGEEPAEDEGADGGEFGVEGMVAERGAGGLHTAGVGDPEEGEGEEAGDEVGAGLVVELGPPGFGLADFGPPFVVDDGAADGGGAEEGGQEDGEDGAFAPAGMAGVSAEGVFEIDGGVGHGGTSPFSVVLVGGFVREGRRGRELASVVGARLVSVGLLGRGLADGLGSVIGFGRRAVSCILLIYCCLQVRPSGESGLEFC